MSVTELMVLLKAFDESGYGGYKVLITYESVCRGKIEAITLDLTKEQLFIGE